MKHLLVTIAVLLLQRAHINAQQIVLDRSVKAGVVTLFPELSNPANFYYFPDQIRLGVSASGQPQFSFIRYVRNSGTAREPASGGISTASDAGGILHALVALQVAEQDLQNARQELQKIVPGAVIKGPLVFKSGKIAIVSSVIGSDGELTKKVVGIGNAPILEGGKAAVSVLLTKACAEILWATFQTAAPDLSFQFEMDVKGFLSPRKVTIEADFDQIYRNETVETAAVTPVFSTQIRSAFEDLNNRGDIRLTQIGDDEDLDKLKEIAYNQLSKLIFEQVGGQNGTDFSQLLPAQQQGVLDRATQMLTTARDDARKENIGLEEAEHAEEELAYKRAKDDSKAALDKIFQERGIRDNPFAGAYNPNSIRSKQGPRKEVPQLAIAILYVAKKVHRSGRYSVDLNKYVEEVRSFPFAENIGDLKSCTSCFKMVNLDDPLDKERNIQIRLVDFNSSDFEKYLDHVEVVFRKMHENGESTLSSKVIDKTLFSTQGNNFSFQYGWKGDNNRVKWLDYEFKTKWVFTGGISIENDWQKSANAVISLLPPLLKREIQVELDPDFLAAETIRSAEVKIYFNPNGTEEVRTLQFKTSDNILAKSAEIILPKNSNDFSYEVTWFFKGKDPVRSSRIATSYSNIYLQKL